MHSLLEHIELLESRLKEVDGDSSQKSQRTNSELPEPEMRGDESIAPTMFSSWPDHNSTGGLDLSLCPEQRDVNGDRAPPSTLGDAAPQNHSPISNTSSSGPAKISSSVSESCPARLDGTEDLVQSFLRNTGQLKYDSSTGHLRHLTSVARYQFYADRPTDSQTIPPAPWQRQRRLHQAIKDLDATTHDHLMISFWSCYNSIVQVVEKTAFQHDKTGSKPKYSGFLHMCCLAMGFRFADKLRPDIQALARGNRHSVFHENARCMLDTELENCCSLTTIQGLLILSDLECAVGRDRLGWMHCGMSLPQLFFVCVSSRSHIKDRCCVPSRSRNGPDDGLFNIELARAGDRFSSAPATCVSFLRLELVHLLRATGRDQNL